MLTRIFGQINSTTSILLGLFVLLLSVTHFVSVPTPVFSINTVWGGGNLLAVAGYSIYGAAVLILVYGFQWLLEFKHKLVKGHAYVPFFITMVTLIFVAEAGLTMLVEMVLMLLVIASWLSSYQAERIYGRSLNTGLLIGLGAMFDARFSMLLLFSFVVYTIFGRLNIRTFLILIIGFLTIWMNAFALEYIILSTNTIFEKAFHSISSPEFSSVLKFDLWQIILLGFLLVAAFPDFINTLNRASVFKRQAHLIFMGLALLALTLFIFNGPSVFQLAVFIPAIVLLFANYFQYIKRGWIRELMMWLLIGILVLSDMNFL